MSVAPALASTLRLEAHGLGHRYAPRRGLETVSFVLEAPGAVAVTGPNGSGKSTLLRILAGLLRPSEGRWTLSDEQGSGPARTRAGYASPDLVFYDELTAGENLEFAGEALGLDRPAERARAALARVGLEARAADRVAVLSSGMKQRLRLAFAVMGGAALLLLDEPGSHLDEAGRAVVARLVDEQRRLGLVVIATNDEREWRLAESRIELRGRGLGDPA